MTTRNMTGKRIHWTAEEDQFLWDSTAKSLREVAEALGRSAWGVQARCTSLGVLRGKPSTYRGGARPRYAPPPDTETVKCLCCSKPFPSVDRKRNRMCSSCKEILAGVPAW